MIRRALAPLATLLFVALPALAWAAPKVAVTAIDGDTESEVRDALAESLDGEDYKLISKKETSRAVDKVGDISDLSEKDAKKLAKDLSADAIISGSLEKSGATKTLKVKLFVNGKMKKGFSVKFKSASSAKFKEALRKKVVEKLDGTTESAAAGGEEDAAGKKPPKKGPKAEVDDEDPNANVKPKNGKGGKPEKVEKPEKLEKPEKTEKTEKTEKAEKAGKGGKGEKAEKPESDEGEKPAAEDDEEGQKPAGKKAAVSEDDEEGQKPAGKKTAAADLEGMDDDDDDAMIRKRGVVASAGRSPNRAAARVDVGPSVVKRSLVFNTNLPPNLAPRPFRPGPVPGIRAEGDLYPLAFPSPNSFLAGLGVAFRLDRTLTMTLNTSAEPMVPIPVNQYHWSVGARFRIVGKSAASPSVTLGADLGRSRFQPDRKGLTNPGSLDLPNTYYKFYAPGLSFRIPLGGLLAIGARGEGWIVSDAGPIVTKNSYGLAKVLGFDTEVGIDILPVKRFAIRLSGGFTQIGYQFLERGGAKANSRDGNATTLDVGGAADRSINAAVTFGAMY